MPQLRVISIRPDLKGMLLGPGSIALSGGRKKGLARLVGGSLPFFACFDEGLEPDQVIAGAALASQLGLEAGRRIALEAVPWAWAASLTLAPLSPLPQSVSPQDLTNALTDTALAVGETITLQLARETARFRLLSASPAGFLLVSPSSQICLTRAVPPVSGKLQGYASVGGLSDQLRLVRELVELPLVHPEAFAHFGVEPPKGVLLYGPPGTGKTLIARAVAQETDAWFASISGPEIIGKYYGESEERLRDLFTQAQQNAPAVVFIDELDAIAPRRQDMGAEKQVERRVVSQLLTLLDGLPARSQVVVMAATNLPDSIDPALRRPGRFDREIEIPMPTRQARKEILAVHCQPVPLADDVDLDQVAAQAYGFVGADLAALVREAALAAWRRIAPDGTFPKNLEAEAVTMDDFKKALAQLSPSVTRQLRTEIAPVSWDDIGGLADAKAQLKDLTKQAFVLAPRLLDAGIRPPRGALVSGPSGTGKTMLAQAVAGQRTANFLSASGPALCAAGPAEAARALREIFASARRAAPAVLFFDEAEALLRPRGRDNGLTSVFYFEMDRLTPDDAVFILAATSRPDLLDSGVFSGCRFDRQIELKLPDETERAQILSLALKGLRLPALCDVGELAKESDSMSGAALRRWTESAAALCLGEGCPLEARHFTATLPRFLSGNSPCPRAKTVIE